MLRGNLIIVLVYGVESAEFLSPWEGCWEGETRNFTIYSFKTDDCFMEHMAQYNPDVILTIGPTWHDFPQVAGSSYETRKRWIHAENYNPDELGRAAIIAHIGNLWETKRKLPLVSVFTPSFRSDHMIQRPYRSLCQQTYNNWEWIVCDDSDDEGATFAQISEMTKNDPRVLVSRSARHSGRIGEMKKRCCSLASGDILVELDHDDELTPDALMHVVNAFQEFPDAGFCYTDFAEVYDDGENCWYGETWAWGFGAYRPEEYNGRNLLVGYAPEINAITIRHITSAPNHIRSWRTDFYWEIGGHNPNLHVADDYELCVRSFLKTRMVRVPKLCYIQIYNRGRGNTTDARRQEIQRLVRHIREHFHNDIHKRLLELGVADFVWDEATGNLNWNAERPRDQKCNYVAT